MIARVWGCRGSLPTPGEATVRYGGNTSCVEIRCGSGIALILDAGTGIKRLGDELDPSAEIHVLLTHLHLDHLEGLRFFAPLWRDDGRVHIWGPSSPVHSLQERIARSFSPPLFPVDLGDIPATVVFHDVPDEAWELDGIRILALAGLASGVDGGISAGARGPFARLHPRPRARPRRRARDARAGLGVGPRARPGRRRAPARQPVHRGRVSRIGSGGGTRAWRTPSASRARRTLAASCCSTTTPTAPTPRSTSLSAVRSSCGTATARPAPLAACEGMTIDLG